jgi:cephalosporin-C deacetylase-like acetyl esterase
MTKFKTLYILIGIFLCTTPTWSQEITVNAAKAGGVYATGEKIVWHIGVQGEGAADIHKVSYVLKKGGLTEMGRGELALQQGGADLETRLDEPGSIFAEFSASIPDKPAITATAGAIVDPEKITPSSPRPADFDVFWKSKIEELKTVPANPVLEPEKSGTANVDYWKITLDNIRGTKIHGQLARPSGEGKKFPALLLVQWAGVYPLSKPWATYRAYQGWLTLNISAHDLPIDSPAEFYKEQAATPLKNYTAIGNEDRETSYFLRMFLGCYRAVDYLASRDDWDGKTIVVMGGSQGGLQTLVTVGLHPQVTAALADVPAGADNTGPLVGRRAPWPGWDWQVRGKDPAKVRETSKYFDVVNFAGGIKCPTLIGAGLIDAGCPAAGIAAAVNQIKAPKEVLFMERAAHYDVNNSHALYNQRSKEWLSDLLAGKSPLKK